MGRVVYGDGPCQGQSADVSDTDLADGYTVCRGFQYRVWQVTDGNWLAQSPALPAPAASSDLPPQPQTLPDPLTTSSALGGWNQLMRALGRDLPSSLREADRARRIIRGA